MRPPGQGRHHVEPRVRASWLWCQPARFARWVSLALCAGCCKRLRLWVLVLVNVYVYSGVKVNRLPLALVTVGSVRRLAVAGSVRLALLAWHGAVTRAAPGAGLESPVRAL